MFEPDEQEPSTGQSERQGSILQRFFSQLGMPAGNSLAQINDSRPGYLSNGLRVPRDYGAPPDLASANASTLNSHDRPSQIDNRVRIQYLLKTPDQHVQGFDGPPLEESATSLLSRIDPVGSISKIARQNGGSVSSNSGADRLLPNRQSEGSLADNNLRNPFGFMRGSSLNEPGNLGSRLLASPKGSTRSWANEAGVSLLPESAGGKQKPTKTTHSAKPQNQIGTQPSTVWMISPDGDLSQVPVDKYQTRLKANDQLAIPLYLKNGVGVYVSQDAFDEFMSKNYESGIDFYQPGMRAVVQDGNGKILREIIVPATNAEQEAQKQGARLLPMTDDERQAYFQANAIRMRYNQANQERNSPEMRSLAQRSGEATKVDPAPKWQPDEYDKGRLMVPGAMNAKQKKDNVKTYLPYVIDGLKWKFGENSWQQYLPYTLASINAESSTFEPVTQGNSKSQSKNLGRGFIQLSADGYRIINDELNAAAKNDAEKVDLIHHPEQANDPKIAGRILAQYLYDRLNGYQGKDARGRPAHRDGLNDLIYGVRDSKIKPEDDPLNPEKALALYMEWLRKPSKNSLTNLQNSAWVRARAVVNGHHDNNLPNGLERFLPALIFADRHQKIVNAAQNPNSTMTLQEVANTWTGGLGIYGDKSYAATLRKRLGLAPGANLAAIRPSDLPPRMLNQMLNVEREYAISLEDALTRAQKQKRKSSK